MNSNQKAGKFLALYGPPGSGKSLATIRGFPAARAYCETGAQPEYLGHVHDQVNTRLNSCDDMLGILRGATTALAKKKLGPGDCLVFEDVNYVWKKEIEGKSGWDRFGVLEEKVMGEKGIVDHIRDLNEGGVHVVWTSHQQAGKTTPKGKPIPGTLKFPGWVLPESMPGRLDLAAHMEYDDAHRGWPWWFRISRSAEWIVKCRLDVDVPALIPANLGALMRAAGYTIKMPEHLKWMDEVRDPMVNALLEELKEDPEADVSDQLRAFSERLLQKYPDVDRRHIRWALGDALDNALLRAQQHNTIEAFFEYL